MEKNPKTMMGSLKRHLRAFSIAELAIILSLVGFVSSVAVGTVIKHVDEQKMELSNVVTNNEVAISLADMHASEELLGLQSEEEFANKLQKHYSVEGAILNKDGTKSSGGSANLADMTYADFVSKNFAASYKDGDKVIKASDYNTVLKTAKGASIALSYNKSCTIGSSYTSTGSGANSYSADAKNAALSCIEGIYDVNGAKGPNKLGVDVGIITNVKGNCEGNFVMDSNGTCGKVCALTTTNCKAENKTLNKDTCACECTVSCPKGQTLNKETCTCECDTPVEFNKVYCELSSDTSKGSCTPIPKNFLTPAKCLSGGGDWIGDSCNCNCDKKDCKSASYGYGWADPNAYCDCKCPFQVKNAEFDAIVRKNAMAAGLTGTELEEAVQRTIPANYGNLTASGNCYACDPNLANNGRISYKAKQGFCAAECDLKAEASCDQTGGFFKWTGFDPNNIQASCKCTCNKDVKKAEAEQLTAQMHSAMKNKVLITNGSSSLVWTRLYQAIQIGGGNSCTYCGNARSSWGTNQVASIANNGGVADYSVRARYTFDENTCAFKFKNTTLYPGQIVDQTHFHCMWSICIGYDWRPYYANLQTFSRTMGYPLPESITIGGTYNPNWNRPNTVPGFTGNFTERHNSFWQNNMLVALGSSYSQWADPIVLNYTNTAEAFPTIVGGTDDEGKPLAENVSFKLTYDAENNTYTEVNTPWIKAHPTDIHKSHVYLATIDPSNAENLVPDVSFLFSDQKPKTAGSTDLYSTGLNQLQVEFDKTVGATEAAKTKGVDSGLVNKNDPGFNNLRIWWDKNNDAKATAEEIKTLDEAKITELNTFVKYLYNDLGEIVQSANAVYGVTGQYKRLIEIGNLNDVYLGKSGKKEVCEEVCTQYSGFGRNKKCAKQETQCSWQTVPANNDIRYVEPVYDKNGKQILDKWKLIQNDTEKANADKAFQELVKKEYEAQDATYQAELKKITDAQDKAYNEAYQKAYDDYMAKWEAARKAAGKSTTSSWGNTSWNNTSWNNNYWNNTSNTNKDEDQSDDTSKETEEETGDVAKDEDQSDDTSKETEEETEEETGDVAKDEDQSDDTSKDEEDSKLASLSKWQAEAEAAKVGKEAGNKAKEAVENNLVAPSKEAISAELAKDYDGNTYYLYSPKQTESGLYNEKWYEFDDARSYSVEYKKELRKVYYINGKWYEEQIYTLSDVLFKF